MIHPTVKEIKMRVQTKTKLKRYAVYGVIILLAHIFQNILTIFPEIASVRPVLLISVALCIAMFEGEVVGAVAGLLSGALWDTLTVTADSEWINSNERVFPVVIDPTISYSDSDVYKAKMKLESVISATDAILNEQSVLSAGEANLIPIQSEYTVSVSESITRYVALGTVLGVALSMFIVLLRFVLDNKVKDAGELEEIVGVSIIAFLEK